MDNDYRPGLEVNIYFLGKLRSALGAPFSPMSGQSVRKSCSHVMHQAKLSICHSTAILEPN